jgi:hypothetical protein
LKRDTMSQVQPLPLAVWPRPLMVALTKKSEWVKWFWESPEAIDGKPRERVASDSGILDAFLPLSKEVGPWPVAKFVEDYGPLLLDDDGLPWSPHRNTPPPDGPEEIARIRHYASLAESLRKIGEALSGEEGVPWDDLQRVQSALEQDHEGRGEWLVGPLFTLDGETGRRASAQSNTRARGHATLVLEAGLNWWLALRPIGPWFAWPVSGPAWFRSKAVRTTTTGRQRRQKVLHDLENLVGVEDLSGLAPGPQLRFGGDAWSAIGVRLSERVMGHRGRKEAYCEWGKHYFPVGRRRTGLACCPEHKYLRNRADQRKWAAKRKTSARKRGGPPRRKV